MNKTLTQIREALEYVLKRLKTTNGYSLDLPDDHIYRVHNAEFYNNTSDDAYPKAFIYLADQNYTDSPSRRVERMAYYTITLVLKELNDGSDLLTRIEHFTEDLADALDHYKTLGGCAVSARLTDMSTDQGVNYPEGVAVFTIEVRYHQQR